MTDNLVISDLYVEPWMRGTHGEVPAAGRAVLHALELAVEDLTKWTDGLRDDEVYTRPLGITPMAFHLKHIARSVDRILCYAEGKQLTAEQLVVLKSEMSGDEPLAILMAEVKTSLLKAAVRVRALAVLDLDTSRGVGRKRLPTSIGGALVHVADHTMRHVGQVVTTAQVLRALRSGSE